MIGTRGVPAKYGGFETCVEEVGKRLTVQGHEVDVYCREHSGLDHHLGMRRVELRAANHRAAETLTHSALSVLKSVAERNPADVAFVFNAANSPLLPLLDARGIPAALHMDGLEWSRSKWGALGRHYYALAEAFGVFYAKAIISDGVEIAKYYKEKYGSNSAIIKYGAPIVAPPESRLRELGLSQGDYFLIVARTEPENHVLEALSAYMKSTSITPLVVVGGVPYASDYSRRVDAAIQTDSRIHSLGSVWDQGLLDTLYAHAKLYVHGHSVGGTNPSRLRAMGAGAPTVAFDVVFNRETLGNAGLYWKSSKDLTRLFNTMDSADFQSNLGELAQSRAAEFYRWDDVAAQYLDLAERLVRGGTLNTRSRQTARASLRAIRQTSRELRAQRLKSERYEGTAGPPKV